MNSIEIREAFFEFFIKKKHKIVSSAPLVIKGDPTLMFTNAGMNQFKNYFLGNKKIINKRVANTQKCLRVSGKHNDLEEVGIDTYHHTMFEMLGNWSFGDYFKQEAIGYAWELLTEVYKLPKERIYATYFGGDSNEKTEEDNESKKLWANYLPNKRILSGSKSDNFWEMGNSGPCGPCSEVHIDLRSQTEVNQVSGSKLINKNHPQVIEIWNLVFIQFNRKVDGSLEELPNKHVDTGMGFERLVMAIQRKKSNYDTDIFQPMIQQLSKKANIVYGENKQKDIALRVIVDHIRAITFAIADGQLPSNNGAGYVIRRILRRASRYGFQFLGFKQPFLAELLPLLKKQFELIFPTLKNQTNFISDVITKEEIGFLKTLDLGLKKINILIEEMHKSNTKILSGKLAFELYDTFGFPFDLTSLIVKEGGLTIEKKSFLKAMETQKNRSKVDAKEEVGEWIKIRQFSEVKFVGYDNLNTQSRILKYRTIKKKEKKEIQLVLDETPFYAESGGQIGDTGILTSEHEKIRVIDTKKENDLIVHYIDKLPANIESTFEAKVEPHKRMMITNNHSATHLMHAALRQVLGNHIEQRGSLVNEKQLRFDFSHFSKLAENQIEEIEQIVNDHIRQNIPLNVQNNLPIEKAKALGAMALFGDKYGAFVRVITFDKNYSVELCGGTHVPFTGQIGLFKIVSEYSIATGIRRIEAITAQEAEQYINTQSKVLHGIKKLLKNPNDILIAIEAIVNKKNKLSKELEAFQNDKLKLLKSDLKMKAVQVGEITVIIDKASLPSLDTLKQLAHNLKRETKNSFIVLVADIEKKPYIVITIDEMIVKKNQLNAGKIVAELAKSINGHGGGQSFFATAGGSKIEGLDKVVKQATTFVENLS